MDRIILKFTWKRKETRTARTVLKKKDKVGGIPLPNSKAYHITIYHQDGMLLAEGPMGQDGDPEIAPEKDRLLFSAKGTKASRWKNSLCKKWCWNNRTSIGKKKMSLDLNLTFL